MRTAYERAPTIGRGRTGSHPHKPAAVGYGRPMAESEKRKKPGSTLVTVIIAFAANFLVAAAKTVAALLSGSASMTAEAAHSWADTGNQVFLFFAERRSARPRDKSHPMGYGREAYVWSMVAAFGL